MRQYSADWPYRSGGWANYLSPLSALTLKTSFPAPFLARFNKEDFSSNGQVKSSVRRGIRCEILEQYPRLESVMGDIFPQKASVEVIKMYVCFPGHR